MVEGKVVLPLEAARTLSAWIHTYFRCAEGNMARLLGHVEKLENRLKATHE